MSLLKKNTADSSLIFTKVLLLAKLNLTQASGLELRSAVCQSTTLHNLHSPQPPHCDLLSINKCHVSPFGKHVASQHDLNMIMLVTKT